MIGYGDLTENEWAALGPCTNASRYPWISTQGPVVLWDYHNCDHLSHHLDLVNEIRQGTAWYFFASGNRIEEMARRWAAEIADLVSQHGGGNRRIGVDRINPEGVVALHRHGLSVVNAEGVLELARAIKSPGEVVAQAKQDIEEVLTVDIDLAQVARRRRAIPLVKEARLGLIRREVDRLLREDGDL